MHGCVLLTLWHNVRILVIIFIYWKAACRTRRWNNIVPRSIFWIYIDSTLLVCFATAKERWNSCPRKWREIWMCFSSFDPVTFSSFFSFWSNEGNFTCILFGTKQITVYVMIFRKACRDKLILSIRRYEDIFRKDNVKGMSTWIDEEKKNQFCVDDVWYILYRVVYIFKWCHLNIISNCDDTKNIFFRLT